MSTEEPHRSVFVTVVAWIFIVISGFATLMTAMQTLMVLVMFRTTSGSHLSSNKAFAAQPLLLRFLFAHPYLWFLLCFLVSAFTLVVSVELLRRRAWARIAFISLLFSGIAWVIFSLFVMAWMVHTPEFSRVADAEFRTMQYLMVSFTAAIGLVIGGLFAWLARTLLGPSVRQEFAHRERLAA